MERGHHESSRDLQPRDTVSPQPPHRERAGEIGTRTHSVLLLIYSRGFLLAEPNRKWEGEEAHWCSHTGRQPWDTQQVGKGGGRMWKGKWEVPYTTALASFITDMPSSFVPSQVLPTLFPVNGSPTCLTGHFLSFSHPPPHDSGTLCALSPLGLQVGPNNFSPCHLLALSTWGWICVASLKLVLSCRRDSGRGEHEVFLFWNELWLRSQWSKPWSALLWLRHAWRCWLPPS